MCRLLLIISNDVSQYNNNLILKFLKQSITKNTPNIISKRDEDFHKDGFGFAWYNTEKDNGIFIKIL